MNNFRHPLQIIILLVVFSAIIFSASFFYKSIKTIRKDEPSIPASDSTSTSNSNPQNDVDQNTGQNSSQSKISRSSSSTENSSKRAKLELLLKKLDPKATWILLTDDNGRINSINGGNIENFSNSYESGLILAQDIAETLDIPRDQIGKTDFQLKETGFNRSYHYQQVYQDYVVDNAYIEFFIDKSNKNIYDITSELRDLGKVDTEIAVSLPSAVEIVREHFKNYPIEIKNEPTKPVIYNEEEGKSHLAWKIVIKTWDDHPGERHVYVSATNGKLVLDHSLIKY